MGVRGDSRSERASASVVPPWEWGFGGLKERARQRERSPPMKKREPEGPLARWEPKLPATFSPSGSGAPSNLRGLRAAAEPPAVANLAARLRLRELRRASRRPVSRGHPMGSPFGVPAGPTGSDLAARSGGGFPIGSLRVLPAPSRPIHLSVSRPPVRPSRVDHLDCLERGERYRRHQGRSTSHPRRSGHERAGRRRRTKSDNSVDAQ